MMAQWTTRQYFQRDTIDVMFLNIAGAARPATLIPVMPALSNNADLSFGEPATLSLGLLLHPQGVPKGSGAMDPGPDCFALIIGSTKNLAFMESSRHKFCRFMMRIRSIRYYVLSERFIRKKSAKPTTRSRQAQRFR